MNEVRYVVRGLVRRPAHSAAVVLLLVIGIAANGAVFSGVEQLLVRPLGVDQPDTLVSLGRQRFSYPNYRSFADRLEGVIGVAAFLNRPLTLTTNDATMPLNGTIVSANYFDVLGITAVKGRTFDSMDADRSTDARTAVMSERFWRTAYAASPEVIGRTVHMNDVAVTIIGVVPAAFRGTGLEYVPDIWLRLTILNELEPIFARAGWVERREVPVFTALARRDGEVTHAQLRRSVDGLVGRLAAEYPRENGRWTIDAVPLIQAAIPKDSRNSIIHVMSLVQLAALFVLLIGVANVTILLNDSAESRGREFAIRLAHGSRAWRLARQLSVEYLILGGLAGGCGLLVVGWYLDRLQNLVPHLPIAVNLDLGPYTVGLVVGLSLVASFVGGLLPAMRTFRLEAARGLNHPRTELAGGATRSGMTDMLLAIQVALTLVLVCGALLFVQILQNKQQIELGFEAEGVLRAQFDLGASGYTELTAKAFRQELVREAAALPGVQTASWAVSLPFEGITMLYDVSPSSAQRTQAETPLEVIGNHVDRNFFATLGIPIIRGQGFSDADQGRRVIVISQLLAHRLWSDGDPIGRRLQVDMALGEVAYDVVGVVGNARYENLEAELVPAVYFPLPREDAPGLDGNLLLKTELPLSTIASGLRQRIDELDKNVAVRDIRALSAALDAVLAPDRLAATTVGAFSLFAILLAGLGLFGTVSRMTGRRRREIGVRIALGAKRRDVLALLLGECATRFWLVYWQVSELPLAAGGCCRATSTRLTVGESSGCSLRRRWFLEYLAYWR